ncbi:MAG: hypothetical protein J6T32_01125 [Paludibacteraceae bacterium]|nr:hypothetical protein [Paludibacteraceae bacterium]
MNTFIVFVPSLSPVAHASGLQIPLLPYRFSCYFRDHHYQILMRIENPDERQKPAQFLRLIDGELFIDIWQEYYDKMMDEDKIV